VPLKSIRDCRADRERSDAEQLAIVQIHCHLCEDFEAVIGGCKIGGCKKVRANLISERLRTGRCPAGKW
jgi:hypothetical protein